MARKLPVYASSSDDKTLKIWQLDQKLPLQVVSGQKDWLRSVALSSDATTAIVGGYDATVSVYDVSKGEVCCGLERRKGGRGRKQNETI